MFSKGQMVFAVLFAISFVVAIVMAFKKERAQHKKNFKGVLKLLLGFILFYCTPLCFENIFKVLNMEQLKTMTALFIGGGFGTLLRYGLSKIGNPWSDHFFWGTFSVNIIGCLLLGLIIGLSYKNPALASAPLYSFLAIGFCGGFTTFSTFAFENQAFLKNGQILEFSLYTLSSIIIGILAISLGLYTAKAI